MQKNGAAVAFCETFDQPFPSAQRSGQLNPMLWGVSRTTGSVSFPSLLNKWALTKIQKCDGSVPTVAPPGDVIVCNGQLREASNDNWSGDGVVTVLAMYPKQPFDFAGRTGTVSFDVSNDTHGDMRAWPEFWLTELPVPAPFAFQGWKRRLPAWLRAAVSHDGTSRANTEAVPTAII